MNTALKLVYINSQVDGKKDYINKLIESEPKTGVLFTDFITQTVARKANTVRTKSAAARSWLNVGETVDKPELGDLVIFKRGTSSWQGHVAIYINEADLTINVLGGNQNNSVSISAYQKKDVLGFRRLL